MSGRPIEVTSGPVQALMLQLVERMDDVSPLLQAMGEDVIEGTKQSFATATGPDGVPWKSNSRATLERFIMQRGGFSKKTGKITAKGQQLAIGKRPLQGHSGDLARQIVYNVYSGRTLEVGSTMRYAAMQQYGGTKAQFPHLWGDIPARPFLPVTPQGTLYPQAEGKIVDLLRQYLTI